MPPSFLWFNEHRILRSLSSQVDLASMTSPEAIKVRCLWHAEDGRCASCKARRIKHDILGQQDYEMCVRERDYPACEFYKEKPVPPPKK